MSGMIKTSRQDLHLQLVENAEADRSDEEGDSSEGPYLFKYQYELFSFAAVYGLFNDALIDEPEEYSQDIRRLTDMDPEDEHRVTIEFITTLVQAKHDLGEDEAWDYVLRYADGGLELLSEELDVQHDFDMIRFVREMESSEWTPLLRDILGDPAEVNARF